MKRDCGPGGAAEADDQIIASLCHAEGGVPFSELCPGDGISNA